MFCKDLKIIDNKFRINTVYEFLVKLLFWNMILRMIMEGYIDYAISSMLNVKNVRNICLNILL